MKKTWFFIAAVCLFSMAAPNLHGQNPNEPIDFNRARELMQKQRQGQTLTPDEQKFLERAKQEYFRQHNNPQNNPQNPQNPQQQRPNMGPPLEPKSSVGLKPLTEMTATDKYKGEDGGLYGGGKNEPPASLAAAAKKELAQIKPLGADGKPAPDGRIVMISMGMSNTTMEFSRFKPLADAYPDKNPQLTIVDCALGGQTAIAWAETKRPWDNAMERLKNAGVTPQQVEVAWVKMANAGPSGELDAHGKKLKEDTLKALQLAKQQFPNLRIAYLSSRIYAGYAVTRLNPEPYAYEGAFAMRWLILDQVAGKPELNCDPAKGEVKTPLLLWGPYLWGDGMTPRKADGLIWEHGDLAGDGTHPSSISGMQKVAELLLKFCKTDPNAKPWFLKK